MSILILQHVANEPACRIGEVLRDTGHRLRVCEIFNGQAIPDLDNVHGVVSMGGPMNVEDQATLPWLAQEMELLRSAHARGVPIVGVCLGAQLLAAALGGEVAAMKTPEVGWANVKLAFPGTIDTIYTGIPWDTTQFHLHGQEVTKLPPGATPLAGSAACRTQAFKVGLRSYGFQYHFEYRRDDLPTFIQDGLFAKAGVEGQAFLTQANVYYDAYRHLGDRLCRNLAGYLFPLDKRAST